LHSLCLSLASPYHSPFRSWSSLDLEDSKGFDWL
jgi:hypothetical protein